MERCRAERTLATIFEFIAGNAARLHARLVYNRFLRSLRKFDRTQSNALRRALAQVTTSELGRKYQLDRVRTRNDLRAAVPLHTYEDFRPWIERVWNGDHGALFNDATTIRMFATSSGTTARQKYIPVTNAFITDYRRGWNTFGLKMYRDHFDAFLRGILQSTGRHDETLSPSGVPCGAITGLLAMTQKGIVKRFYVGGIDVARLPNASARYYTLIRLGVMRDVAYAITANPATLIQMARIADEYSETLIRDVRDGTLSEEIVGDYPERRAIEARFSPDPSRARSLEQLRSKNGAVRPRDIWRLSFVACWTGGSMGHYLPRVRDWWGPIPIRDIGLLASEGRVSIPLDDDSPVGVVDLSAGVFEFIPVEDFDAANPRVYWADELETGREYAVVMTNTTGLLRYRLDDIVRVHGYLNRSPLIEFLYRGGRVASVAGEKLTENQLVAAFREAVESLRLHSFDFVAVPVWDDPPYYRITCSDDPGPRFVEALDQSLCNQNHEYASRRKSGRLSQLQLFIASRKAFAEMDERLISRQRSRAEQYKRPCLLIHPAQDEILLGTRSATALTATHTVSD